MGDHRPAHSRTAPWEDGRGRPWKDSREVIDGILWVLRSGARCEDLPERFPPYQTCHCQFQQWVGEGALRSVLEALAEDLRARGDLDLGECFTDGMFIVAKKGARSGKDQARQRYEAHGSGPTALVFLSPFTQRLLRRMKSPLSQTLSSKASQAGSRSGCSEIRRMTAT